jgi:hypothetical protein
MADKESAILKNIMLALSKAGARVFRNNSGYATYPNGAVVKYGIANPGGSDCIGWHSIIIKPEDVGTRKAVFVAIEVKTEKGRLKPEQENFLNAVKKAGGYAGVATSPEQALVLLTPTASTAP